MCHNINAHNQTVRSSVSQLPQLCDSQMDALWNFFLILLMIASVVLLIIEYLDEHKANMVARTGARVHNYKKRPIHKK
uniref:Neur_chan_memb domain-containing protein n=1 Tax=Steinernema glaseri TaxID=37863 RepID=A0A1I7Z6C5_9BILA